MKVKTNVFDYFLFIFILLFVLFVFIPVWYVFVISTSTYEAYINDTFHLIPKSFTLNEYKRAFLQSQEIMSSLWVTIKVVVFGVITSMAITLLGGYALSKKTLPGRSAIISYLIFTMFFGGGLAPTYILVRGLGITNTILALILPMAVSTYNVILVKNFFGTIPESIEESALIDGANAMQVFALIVLPMSTALIAAISLFYAVGYYNSYFLAMLYTSSKSLRPFQQYLRSLVIENEQAKTAGISLTPVVFEQYKMAVIIIGILPMVIVYPFVQRFFTHGVVMGSIKG